MRFLPTVVGFAATVSGLNLQKHFGQTCSGNYRVCTNLAANTCCVGATAESILYTNFPSSWRIECRGYDNGNCSRLRANVFSAGQTSICVQGGGILFTAGNYGFVSRKRSPLPDQACPAGTPARDIGKRCAAMVEPDTLVLVDGSKFNLVGLSAERRESLYAIAADPNVTSGSQIPEEFKSLAIE